MIDWDALVLAPCMAVFGEEPEMRPMYRRQAGGAPFPVDGIFDDAYLAVIMAADGDPAIATIDPVMGVRLAQFPAEPEQGDTVMIPRVAKTYMVSNVQPDGKGGAKLVLTRTAPAP